MRPDALRNGAQALRYWEERQQVVAHNLANAETTGFKGERLFARLLGETLATQAATDMRAGALTPTGAALDLALEGDGFLVIETAEGERLTRGGGFRLDDQGRITDPAGNALLGTDGPIVVRDAAEVLIRENGAVVADGFEVGRLRVVRPAENARLVHEDGIRFRVDGELVDAHETGDGGPAPRVRQGYLERSNVDALQTMVEMIEIQRSYAAVQSTLRTMDGINERVANQIGRV